MAEPINWSVLMRHGLGTLRLSPDAFWNMTPAELRFALEGAGLLTGDPALDRDWLTSLMCAYPDDTTTPGHAARPKHYPEENDLGV